MDSVLGEHGQTTSKKSTEEAEQDIKDINIQFISYTYLVPTLY